MKFQVGFFFLQVGFFSTLRKLAKNFSFSELIMSEISANLKNLFWPQKPPILKVEIRFYSDRKCFSQIFENWPFFFHLNFISIKKKIRTFFDRSGGGSLTHALSPLRSGCVARGIIVLCARLRCTRLQHRTCNTSRGHIASHGLSAHGLSTERARLAGGTSLRLWFQKKCLLPVGIFFSPDFEISNRIFFRKSFLQNG